MNRTFTFLAAVLVSIVLLAACGKKAEPPAPAATPQRKDFTPEEFGIGRPHTKNAACNREIDQLLDQIRDCVNTRSSAACQQLQDEKNERITRLKNSAHCRR